MCNCWMYFIIYMKTVYEVQPPVNRDKHTDTASQKYFIEILQLCFFVCFLSTYDATSQSHAVLSMSKRQGWWCLFSYRREIDKCNQLPCVHQKYFSISSHLYQFVCWSSPLFSPNKRKLKLMGSRMGSCHNVGCFKKLCLINGVTEQWFLDF